MDSLIDLSLAISIWFQGLGEGLYPLMKGITFLGSEEFYLLIMPVLYWSVDHGVGNQMAFLLLAGTGINSLLKLGFHSPRPYWVSNRIRPITTEPTYGFPSGHAQNAASLWGFLSTQTGRAWARVGWVGLILLIGLSRIILGVHFIHDVIGGWVIGGVLLFAYRLLAPPLKKRAADLHVRTQLLLGFLASLALILPGLFLTSPLMRYRIPTSWIEHADGTFDPLRLDSTFTAAGAMFGFLAGVTLLKSEGGFSNRGSWGQQALRFAVGFCGVMLFWYGLDVLFPEGSFSITMTLRYFRYLLVGLWISYGAPTVFVFLDLAERENRS